MTSFLTAAELNRAGGVCERRVCEVTRASADVIAVRGTQLFSSGLQISQREDGSRDGLTSEEEGGQQQSKILCATDKLEVEVLKA